MLDRLSAFQRFRLASVLLTLAALPLLGLLSAGLAPTLSVEEASVDVPAPAALAAPIVERAPAARLIAEGKASYYGPGLEGNRTANGEIFRMSALTAAHRSLPFGSRVRVTNLRTGKTVVVRINDRGPFVGRRIIDLSKEAARQIGMVRRGTDQVRLELLPSSNAPEASREA
ncbi:MAG: septal ring lytic transglycosylase RlpA family protein [Bacteroidota bacterium]